MGLQTNIALIKVARAANKIRIAAGYNEGFWMLWGGLILAIGLAFGMDYNRQSIQTKQVLTQHKIQK